MGTKKVKFISEPQERAAAFQRILRDIECLEEMIEEGLLDYDKIRLGVEQELFFIDRDFGPASVIEAFMKKSGDSHFTEELAKFNVEINTDPLVLRGNCFTELEKQLIAYIEAANRCADKIDQTRVIMVGILPTLNKMDVGKDCMTENDRSRGMVAAMNEMRRDRYSIRIHGLDELYTEDYSNLFQSCNTSFQVHYQLNPDTFAEKFNFALAISAPVLAACTNSPLLFGKRLWHETRIALFEEAVDTRKSTTHLSKEYRRVLFGNGWVSSSISEVFKDYLARFQLFQVPAEQEDIPKKRKSNETPELRNLDAFNSSVFPWTRACYGSQEGRAHLRVENRLLPSGPTVVDEVANAALWLGLMHGMPERYSEIAKKMKFSEAHDNILKAARYGLNCTLKWKGGRSVQVAELLIDELLPIAEEGLQKAKVRKNDIDRYLGIVRKRIENRQTGSQWMLDAWNALDHLESRNHKSVAITAAVFRNQSENKPVHEWSMPDDDFDVLLYRKVRNVMTADIFSVEEDDIIERVVLILSKKSYSHIPVVNRSGEIQGLLSSQILLDKYAKKQGGEGPMVTVADVMEKDPSTVSPSDSVNHAIEIMKKNKRKCLLVEHTSKLVGLLTEYDLMKVLEYDLSNEKKSNG